MEDPTLATQHPIPAPAISPSDPSTWPVFMDVDQVSLILAMPVKTVYELLKAKKIKGKKFGREWRVKAADLLTA